MAKNNASEKMVINGRNMKITSGPVGTTASVGSRVFDVFNYVIIGLISITTILPFIYVLGASFATEYELQTRPMFLIPHDVTFNAYRYIFSSSKLIRSFGNSVFMPVAKLSKRFSSDKHIMSYKRDKYSLKSHAREDILIIVVNLSSGKSCKEVFLHV